MSQNPEPEPPFQFHCVKHPGNKVYLLVDDVAEFLRDLGSTEPTDTRNMLEEAAEKLLKLKE